MNVTAIRYYIDNALLTPQKKNNQYVFDQSCIDDMDKILEYKLKKFSSIQVQKQDESSAGIPFSFIPYLYCPKCGASLSMSNTTIHNGHLYEGICALLRDTGLLIGLIGDYKDAPKSVQNIKKDHPDYPAEKMPPSRFRANMKTNGLELQEMKLVGSTHGNEMHFPRNEVGEQVSMLGYTAVKK